MFGLDTLFPHWLAVLDPKSCPGRGSAAAEAGTAAERRSPANCSVGVKSLHLPGPLAWVRAHVCTCMHTCVHMCTHV